MKITAIRATPVNIPLDAPFFWSVGLYPGTTKVVIEVETDQGLIGLGESPSPGCAAVINSVLAPALIGMNALDMESCERKCVQETRVVHNTDDASILKSWGGVEMALWDLRGKAWNQPLYMLLGGPARKEIKFTEYFCFRPKVGRAGGEMTPRAIADYCRKMREKHGATYFEGKLCMGDPRQEIEAVKLIRRAIGDDAMLRLDANMGWSVPTAKRILNEIEQYNIRNYEDPVATFEEMAKLRQHSAVPFSTHTPDLRQAVRLGVPDYFVLNLTVLGGIRRTSEFVAACKAFDVGFWCYSGETGIGNAAYLHFVAAHQWITEPSQSIFRWQCDDVIRDGNYKPKNNVLRVLEGPGLGVTLDPKGFRRCADRYKKDGPLYQYRDPYAPTRGELRRLPLD
ncbi:MAG: mandelate racemase/muconate lactonizing enzyme family protein [Planctomycetes bacterium]|nr:mandelate racemase/muconate lactonizing enzyme family protein [Planctomycetota bacterium]